MRPRLQIGVDSQEPQRLAPFWASALGYAVGDLDRDGIYLDLVPPDASSPVVYFQRVPEEKRVKNRVHLDLYSEDPETVIAALLELGARKLDTPRSGSEGGWWQVMVDPEGNEFCVCREG
ncbi:MAG TPA: VOC family protein [Acidimicrobiales bacterium]|nr:VOC family protein [Acidimicrobiales bacterium]